MNTRLITQTEIISHQQAIRSDFQRSRVTFSVAGLRRLFGNTLIAMGTRLHGGERTRPRAFVNPVPAA